ncbi:MAG: NAD-dependent epimerase/dehydratase family protein [Anaerolineales bacterium]|nr:NAD-dependent epimerase/dehydratase family protein [Anaerolineales bacterium]
MSGFWADKQAVVTGAGGFLGSQVVDHLQAAGCAHVFAAHSRAYDLTDAAAVGRMFAAAAAARPAGMPFVVFHIAGLAGGIAAHLARPAEFFYHNVVMNTLTLHQAWQAGALRLVAAGAGNGYPVRSPNPLQEHTLWDGYPQPETAPYGLAKRLLAAQSLAYWQQHGFASSVAILGNLYGPRDKFDSPQSPVIAALISKFVAAVEAGHAPVTAWGTGRATRDLVYVGDVAEALVRAAEVYSDAQVFNVASGSDTSIRQVVELLARLTGFQGEVQWDTSKPDGQSARRFDIDKARRELGWQPRTDLETGLQQTVAWYRARRASEAAHA